MCYCAGSIVGGASLGAIVQYASESLRGASPFVDTGVTAFLVLVALLAILSDSRLRPVPLQRRAQVPRRWVNWRHRSFTASAFGLVLGAAAVTLLHFSSMYALLAIVALAPDRATAVAIGAVWGLARGLTVVAVLLRHDWKGGRPPKIVWPFPWSTARTVAGAAAVSFISCSIILSGRPTRLIYRIRPRGSTDRGG